MKAQGTSVPDIAKILGCSRATVYRYLSEQSLPAELISLPGALPGAGFNGLTDEQGPHRRVPLAQPML
ncbi:helix-turn-helix domain-containing protein [Nocardia sp. NPDC101769]|uniref:helix-turn-helix domain-containing protein n=1 Tax=Nocardia sp. NPDC101769 TaxID=3364333 RepID=UPI003827645F